MYELCSGTSGAWASSVLADEVALLDDHAHLERNAAANTLELTRQRSYAIDRTRWVERLNSITRDEVEHLGLVNRELAARNAQLSISHTNPYAAGLRRLIRRGDGPRGLADRLLVSGLIEARSHQRFEALAASEHALGPMYGQLAISEAGHHRVFVQLAEQVAPEEDIAARWQGLAFEEAAIMAEQATGPRMHSGEPSS